MFDIQNYKIPSPSFLKQLSISPARALYRRMNPKDSTKAQDWATAIERAVLEPEKLDEYYFCIDTAGRPEPEKNMNSKLNKAWRNEKMDEAGLRDIITVDEMKMLREAGERVRAQFGHIIDSFPLKQFHLQGDLNGIQYHGFCDGLADKATAYVKPGDVLEVKACPPGSFMRTATKEENQWDVQGAAYLNLAGGNSVWYLAIDPKPPFDAQVFQMPKGSDNEVVARTLLKVYLKAFADCKQNPEKWKEGPNYWTPLPPETDFKRWGNDFE